MHAIRTRAVALAAMAPYALRRWRDAGTSYYHEHCYNNRNTHSEQLRARGDFSINIFHNCNPEHGAPYAQHERRMRDDEVEDFMRSVKGWQPLHASATPATTTQRAHDDNNSNDNSDNNNNNDNDNNNNNNSSRDTPPERDKHMLGDDAIVRTFVFECFADAYNFVGRLWAFCYSTDKYPIVSWEKDGRELTVYLYSASYHGLSKREARVAAFCNDQYNMLRKSKQQQARLLQQQQQQQMASAYAPHHGGHGTRDART